VSIPEDTPSATLLARQTLAIASPYPVQETAAEELSAYPPQPTRGESPTRPTRFAVIPPVEVPAAKFPSESSTTAPTVS